MPDRVYSARDPAMKALCVVVCFAMLGCVQFGPKSRGTSAKDAVVIMKAVVCPEREPELICDGSDNTIEGIDRERDCLRLRDNLWRTSHDGCKKRIE